MHHVMHYVMPYAMHHVMHYVMHHVMHYVIQATDPDLCKRLHDSHSGNSFFPRPDPRKVGSRM